MLKLTKVLKSGFSGFCNRDDSLIQYHTHRISKNSSRYKKVIAIRDFQCVKSVRIRSFSGTYFPVFGLNTERYYRLMLKWLTLMWKNFELYRELVMVANLIKKFWKSNMYWSHFDTTQNTLCIYEIGLFDMPKLR